MGASHILLGSNAGTSCGEPLHVDLIAADGSSRAFVGCPCRVRRCGMGWRALPGAGAGAGAGRASALPAAEGGRKMGRSDDPNPADIARVSCHHPHNLLHVLGGHVGGAEAIRVFIPRGLARRRQYNRRVSAPDDLGGCPTSCCGLGLEGAPPACSDQHLLRLRLRPPRVFRAGVPGVRGGYARASRTFQVND